MGRPSPSRIPASLARVKFAGKRMRDGSYAMSSFTTNKQTLTDTIESSTFEPEN
jgi:hypothetical protein